ncbi:hypothetical protein JCM19992_27270 [Thermostilla marina]
MRRSILPVSFGNGTPPTLAVAACLSWAVTTFLASTSAAEVLQVGPGRAFARIEDAVTAANPGDVIEVYALENNEPYETPAVLVRKPKLTIRGIPAAGRRYVPISGKGFEYSGRGSTPRAIFQFDPGADGCTLAGFSLSGAHNHSHNGAGVRINQANDVTIRDCEIHHNDMGIMSNGDGTLRRGRSQRIIQCHIHHNGDFEHPGYNHNLYLGGTSAALLFCEVDHSLTGHNVKSRAHQMLIAYCYVHDSANREFDLVDAEDTAAPDSHAVLLGNIIVKDPQCRGNRTTIHFGQDGGRDHNGTLYALFNTIVTPFVSPVVDLSAPGAEALLYGNFVTAAGRPEGNQQAVQARSGALLSNVQTAMNWFDGRFRESFPANLARDNVFTTLRESPFAASEALDFRLRPELVADLPVRPRLDAVTLPELIGLEAECKRPIMTYRYAHPCKGERVSQQRPIFGAIW